MSEEQKRLLRLFAAWCYGHAEDTGDYAMDNIDELIDEFWKMFSETLNNGQKGGV